MPNLTLGDMAHSFLLRKQSLALQRESQRLSTEVATGRAPDTAGAVKGDLVPLSAIETSLRRLEGYKSATADAELYATAMQATLGKIDKLSEDLATTLLSAGRGGQTRMLPNAGVDAEGRLDSALTALNIQVGGRTAFAGENVQGAAIVDKDTLLGLLDGVVAGAATGADVADRIAAWFADPAGFAAQGYLGGDPLGAVPVSQAQDVRLDITAADPAIRTTIEGLALAAMLNRASVPQDTGAKTVIASRAGDTLMGVKTARTDLAARLGMTEQRIADAKEHNDAEKSAMTLARSALLDTDPYEASTRLEATETQIETLYAVTARLSRLSLVDFLR